MKILVIMAMLCIVSCESGLRESSNIGFESTESNDFIYANNVTVTLEQGLTSLNKQVAPIPHFDTQTLSLNTIESVQADINNTTTPSNYSVSDTAEALKESLKLGGSMASHVEINVIGVRNNDIKATFTVIVNENSGYQFANGIADRFNITSDITTMARATSKWIEDIDMSKHTLSIEASRHIAGGAYGFSFPDTDTVIFKNGAISESKIISLKKINEATSSTSTITRDKLAEITKNAITEAINKNQSLKGKVIVTTSAEQTISTSTTPITTLKVKITIKAKDGSCILTGLSGGKKEATGTVTIKVPTDYTITD